MMMAEGSESAILPAALLRNTLCVEQRLSKRAAALLRRECDGLAARLLARAFADRTARGGPLEARDIWEALLTDPSCAWLAPRLGLWSSLGASDPPAMPVDVPLPLPPPGLTPDSDLLPRILWLRAPIPMAGAGAMPLHEGLLEPRDSDDGPAAKRPRAEPPAVPTLHPTLLLDAPAAAVLLAEADAVVGV